LVYADDLNLLGVNIDTIKKNTQTLIDTTMEVNMEVHVGTTKYTLLSCYRMQGKIMT
jgi:hypothetical protein